MLPVQKPISVPDTEPKPLCVLDTNIFVYALEASEDRRCLIAQEKVRSLLAPDSQMVVLVQTLGELYHVMRSKYADPPVRKKCADFIGNVVVLRSLPKIHYSEKTIIAAIRLSDERNLHFWDCLLIAAMKENGITRIYTENVSDFRGVDGIEAVNPFFR
jgi:predicted nucleic acid-binding protein